MEKINPSVKRSFTDLITVTINFMKQEFVPFIRAFAVIGFPVILLAVFLMKDLLMETLEMSLNPGANMTADAAGGMVMQSLLTGLFGGLLIMWVQLFSIAYLRVYWDHYQAGNRESILIGEVFQMMLRKMGIYILWTLLYGLIVLVGFIFLIVPGVYISVALIFGTYLIILRDKGLHEIIASSMGMIKHNWWRVFGYAVILQLLVSVVAYLFGLPYLGVTISAAIAGEVPNVYILTFTLLLSYLGQYMLYTVVFIGIGMLFFSRSEEMEHTTLLNRIGQLGAEPKGTDEGAR